MTLHAQARDGSDTYTTRDKLLVLSLVLAMGTSDWNKITEVLARHPHILSSEPTPATCKQVYNQATAPANDAPSEQAAEGEDVGERVRNAIYTLKSKRLDEICDELERIDAGIASAKIRAEESGASPEQATEPKVADSTDNGSDAAMTSDSDEAQADHSLTTEAAVVVRLPAQPVPGAVPEDKERVDNSEKSAEESIDSEPKEAEVTAADNEPKTEVYSTPREAPDEEDVEMRDAASGKADTESPCDASMASEREEDGEHSGGEQEAGPQPDNASRAEEEEEGVAVKAAPGADRGAANYDKPDGRRSSAGSPIAVAAPEESTDSAQIENDQASAKDEDSVEDEVPETNTAMADLEAEDEGETVGQPTEVKEEEVASSAQAGPEPYSRTAVDAGADADAGAETAQEAAGEPGAEEPAGEEAAKGETAVKEEDEGDPSAREEEDQPTTSSNIGSPERTLPYTHPKSTPTMLATADEQQLRNWKKNINMVWREIAGHRLGSMFISPIKSSDAPNYYDVIRQPLDLKTIKNRIRDEGITTTVEFYRDIMHMLMNALMYNAEDTEVYQMTMEIIPDAQACIEQLLQTEAAVNQPKTAASIGEQVAGSGSGGGGVVKSEEDGGATVPMLRGKSSNEDHDRAGDESDSSVPDALSRTDSRMSTKRKRRMASERASKQLRV
ncbi:hypothetical protein GQ54DRAFT_297427 [Martensiomyces pterosporus]|nr:hypothetical protein GQ54DRAFT_297427 [Martensiomyces pterosporus]